jgi:molybdenum cofactor cytidylyltransferase
LSGASSKAAVPAIVLAAGAATRMGRLKQLLPYRGRTLVEHSVRHAIEAGFKPVIVVVGAEAEAVAAALAAEPVVIARNVAWESGMGSSIATGMRYLDATDSDAVAILLADQPLVTSNHLVSMASLLGAPHVRIVAAEYNGTLGVPALFKREIFPLLSALPPEAGARHLLRGSRAEIRAYPLPEAAMDIDTPEDFEALNVKSKSNDQLEDG